MINNFFAVAFVVLINVTLLLQTAASEQLVINSYFKDYGPIDPATAMNTLPFHGWKETGIGGHALVGTTFGAFSGLAGANGVLLTDLDQGIMQTINGTVAGTEYFVDAYYAQVSTVFHPTIKLSIYDGSLINPTSLLSSYYLTLDSTIWGDGPAGVGNSYAHFFTAASSMSTILVTAVKKDGPNDLGPVVGAITVEPVPEPSTYALTLAGIACGGYSMWRRRKRHAA